MVEQLEQQFNERLAAAELTSIEQEWPDALVSYIKHRFLVFQEHKNDKQQNENDRTPASPALPRQEQTGVHHGRS